MKSLRKRVLLWPVIFLTVVLPSFVDAAEPLPFTIVLLPDTQFYSKSFPRTYLAQTQWVRDRAEADNIKFVVHLGDIVQNPDSEEQWRRADCAHRVLDGSIAYSVAPGNHDMLERDTDLYNKYFPPKRFEKQPWYGGHFRRKNDNNYCLFEAGDLKFLVLNLKHSPHSEELTWASKVITAHPEHRVILATHEYLTPKNERTKIGQYIWDKLVRKHLCISLVLCGHLIGVGLQQSTNDAGERVYEILTDYQGLPNGGNGWLRTLRFIPGENKIHVRAYSPLLDRCNDDPAHTYTLEYDMSPTTLRKAG